MGVIMPEVEHPVSAMDEGPGFGGIGNGKVEVRVARTGGQLIFRLATFTFFWLSHMSLTVANSARALRSPRSWRSLCLRSAVVWYIPLYWCLITSGVRHWLDGLANSCVGCGPGA